MSGDGALWMGGFAGLSGSFFFSIAFLFWVVVVVVVMAGAGVGGAASAVGLFYYRFIAGHQDTYQMKAYMTFTCLPVCLPTRFFPSVTPEEEIRAPTTEAKS